MPFDSNGNYTLPTSYFVENGDTVLPVQHNPPFEDVAQALSATLLRDGRSPMLGDLKMGAKKIVNLAAGVATSDAVNKAQLDAVSDALTSLSSTVGIVAGLRNKVINPNFDIWQRGNGPFTTGYCADRWHVVFGTGASNSVSRTNFVPTDSVPFVEKYCLNWARTVAGSASSFIGQKIEGVRTLAGKKVTLTLWASANLRDDRRRNLGYSRRHVEPLPTVDCGVGIQ